MREFFLWLWLFSVFLLKKRVLLLAFLLVHSFLSLSFFFSYYCYDCGFGWLDVRCDAVLWWARTNTHKHRFNVRIIFYLCCMKAFYDLSMWSLTAWFMRLNRVRFNFLQFRVSTPFKSAREPFGFFFHSFILSFALFHFICSFLSTSLIEFAISQFSWYFRAMLEAHKISLGQREIGIHSNFESPEYQMA